jgi:endonuclease/exonuclease/phosphatase family metal-dependent hydrolase
LALLLVAVLAVGTWHASLRQPTGPAAGVALQGPALPPAAPRETFRFGTFNIHGCVGADGRHDEARVARCLEGLDVVGLNEVRGWSFRESANQAAALANHLNVNWLYAPAELRWHCQQFGNGLLSRLPADRWERIPLPGRFAKSRRNMLLVQIRPGNRTVEILLTHLIRSDSAMRQQQFKEAASLFLSLKEPAIMAGDLNADGSDPQIRKLLAVPGVVDALAARRPSHESRNIDWILVRGLQPVDAGFRDDGASDHPVAWAELALPD